MFFHVFWSLINPFLTFFVRNVGLNFMKFSHVGIPGGVSWGTTVVRTVHPPHPLPGYPTPPCRTSLLYRVLTAVSRVVTVGSPGFFSLQHSGHKTWKTRKTLKFTEINDKIPQYSSIYWQIRVFMTNSWFYDKSVFLLINVALITMAKHPFSQNCQIPV